MQQMKSLTDDKLKDKEDTINQLRYKITDYQKQLNSKQSEIENLKI